MLEIPELNFSIHSDFTKGIEKKLGIAATRAEHAFAVQVQKDTEPFVPARTKSLVNRTQTFGSQIVYPGPYARYLYYGKVMVDARTGKGPMRIVGEDGSEVIRFRKGAVLRPSDRPLKISKSVHKNAQSYWFEASKAKNMEKWETVAGKLVKKGLGQ